MSLNVLDTIKCYASNGVNPLPRVEREDRMRRSKAGTRGLNTATVCNEKIMVREWEQFKTLEPLFSARNDEARIQRNGVVPLPMVLLP